jgi:L-ribulokinase
LSIVAGIDFGTLSVRASIFDSSRGRLGSGVAQYPLHRKRDDPDHATQSHTGHMNALVDAVKLAISSAGIDGSAISAVALDTTGSSVVPVDEHLQPLDDYYLWCDHRAWREAQLITRTAHELGLEAIGWCGGVYSSEWGFSKVLHWLRNNPEKRASFATALEIMERHRDRFDWGRMLSSEYRLEQATEALQRMERLEEIKAVVRPWLKA